MVAAVSLDEYIARNNESDILQWTSKEDKVFFSELKSKHNMFIMGSKTYRELPIKPVPGTLRVVMTHAPEKYINEQISGQIEFVNLSAKEIVLKYSLRFDEALILGGSHVYQQFIEADLVDEIYLTIEPIKHVNGTPLLSSGKKLEDAVELPESKITNLNNTGTTLRHYIF